MNIKKHLPDEHEEIIDRVLEKCRTLINLNYWNNIEIVELMLWLKNFNNGEERYLACAILDSIIFRNKESIYALSSQLFHIVLPQILDEKKILKIKCIESWESNLLSTDSRNLVPIRFTTIEGTDHRTAKSGQVLLREIQRSFFDKNLILSIKTISDEAFIQRATSKVKAIVIIDDILASGTQFNTFIEKYALDKLPFHFIFCPFAGISSSISNINNKYSNIHIEPIELLGDENKFFSKENKLLNLINDNGFIEFKKLYLEICKRDNINKNGALGFGDQELTYIFSDSTPNNNLSILTHRNSTWKNLFKR